MPLPRPSRQGAKGTYIQRVAISSTMGPGVKVDLATVTAGTSRLRRRSEGSDGKVRGRSRRCGIALPQRRLDKFEIFRSAPWLLLQLGLNSVVRGGWRVPHPKPKRNSATCALLRPAIAQACCVRRAVDRPEDRNEVSVLPVLSCPRLPALRAAASFSLAASRSLIGLTFPGSERQAASIDGSDGIRNCGWASGVPRAYCRPSILVESLCRKAPAQAGLAEDRRKRRAKGQSASAASSRETQPAGVCARSNGESIVDRTEKQAVSPH